VPRELKAFSLTVAYAQGKSVNGAGINSSFAVHQDATGRWVPETLRLPRLSAFPLSCTRTLSCAGRTEVA
jgi:hypothetical protein